MRILALLTLPCAVAFAIAVAAVRVVSDPSPPPVAQRATATVWGGRVFVSRSDLARWLRSRGASYTVWSKRHPPRPVARTQTEPKSTPVAARPSRREAPAQASGSGLLERSRLLAAGAAVAGLGAVVLLYRRLRRHDFRLPALPRLGVGRRVPRRPAINVGGVFAVPRRRVPRLPAVNVEGFVDAIEPALRGAQRTTHFVLHRRSEVAWVVATSGLAIAVAVLLPHL